MMPTSRRFAALVVSVMALGFLASIVGCGKKEEEPNAPGYYTGPRNPKDAAGKPSIPADTK
jgi:predicted small lipoprotein YifL